MTALAECTRIVRQKSSFHRPGVSRSVDYIFNDDFNARPSDLENETTSLIDRLHRKSQAHMDIEFLYCHGLGDLPVLDREEEASCFRSMNFRKHQMYVAKARPRSDHWAIPSDDQLQQWNEDVLCIRNYLIHSNLRLVIAVVKKFVSSQFSFDELYSEGVMTLMQAVEKFDYNRGFRFSTYAFRSISRALYNCLVKQQQHQMLFVDGPEQWDSDAIPSQPIESLTEQLWRSMRERLAELVQRLDRREQLIVRARYALTPSGKIRTFQALANKLGISKERVRQLEQRAVAKLQAMASELEMAG